MGQNKKRGRPPGPNAAYRKVADSLKKRLHAQEWEAHDTLPSIRQLAKEYDVGSQVIRLALTALKAEDRIGLNPRGQAIVKNQGYIATAIGSVVVEVLGHNLADQWKATDTSNLQKGIERGVGRRTDPLLIAHDAKRLRSVIPPDLMDLPISGILLFGQFTPEVLKEYKRLNIATVLVDQPGEDSGLTSVSVDNVQSAYMATKRLLELGHSKIAFLRYIQLGLRKIDPDSKEREAGFRLAFKDAGLEAPKNATFNMFSKDTENCSALRSLLSAKPRFTAAVCVDLGRATVLLKAAQKKGWVIPRDFSVVSFHAKSPTPVEFSGPQIDFEELGFLAVKALIKKKPGAIHHKVMAQWHDGKTMAPPSNV